MGIHVATITQLRTPVDFLGYLQRRIDKLSVASDGVDILDAAIAAACDSWIMTQWLFPLVDRNLDVRHALAKRAELATANLDLDMFQALVAELCPSLEVCQAIASDPRRLMVFAASAGWQLQLLEDGEAKSIPLECFERVVTFWRGFIHHYFADEPILPRAA
jgi:hypothetical protein